MIEFKYLDIGTSFRFDDIVLEKVTEKTALNIGYPVNAKKRVYFMSPYNLVESI